MSVISNRLYSLLIKSDTTPTRFYLALAASSWALGLFPGNTFERPAYIYMTLFGMNERSWEVLWTLHAGLMFWRIFSTVPRPRIAFAVNLLGLVLFWTVTIAFFAARPYPFPAGIATDLVTALASFWVFVRTGINSEKGWRVD